MADNAPQAQQKELQLFRSRAVAEHKDYDNLLAELTANHRSRARQAYGADTLVWETAPDDAFTPLSLPDVLEPQQSASIHTVVNALEATALGVANLAEGPLPLKIDISKDVTGGPQVSVRVARFFLNVRSTLRSRCAPGQRLPASDPRRRIAADLIEVESTAAQPGIYGCEITIRLGEQMRRIPLTVHVHHVTLGRETPIATGNWSDLNTGEANPYSNLKEVRNSMLAHRITVGPSPPGPSRKRMPRAT